MRNINVLLIDDDGVTNLINQKIINTLEVINNVRAVNNGYEALQIFESNNADDRPQIILVDLQMPVMDGFQFIEALQKHHSSKSAGVKIIVLTVADTQQNKNRAKELGVNHFITKPVSPTKIRSIVLQESDAV